MLIAQLMLQPADVLLLDEPTNDLDIPTLEILEESLLEFKGSLVLVTHDRYMLDRVSTIVLGLDGRGGAESFADYSQWEIWQAEGRESARTSTRPAARSESSEAKIAGKTRLSYLEAREYASIEGRVAAAEELYCRPNVSNWRIRRLPATVRVFSPRTPRWKQRRAWWMTFTGAGLSWKRRKGKQFGIGNP